MAPITCPYCDTTIANDRLTFCPNCDKQLPKGADTASVKARVEEDKARKLILAQFPIYTINPFPLGSFKNMGLVSSFVALGTGPIASLMASWTDFFGAESTAYNDKMVEATNACIVKIKNAAYESGANAIIGLQTTFTELTAGHGQVMVAMIGTAIKIQNY